MNANNSYGLIITPPEEGALAAWNALEPLMKALAIPNKTAPMDLAIRVLTNGEAVGSAIKQVKNDKNAVYLKGPGITPSDKQMLETITKLEQKNALKFSLNDKKAEAELQAKVDALRAKNLPIEQFAAEVKSYLNKIGSPNAKWRDDLEVTLERGVSDELAKRSTYKPAVWNKETPFEVLAMAANAANTLDGKISGGSMKIIHTATDGKEKITEEKLGEGSAVRLFTSNAGQVSDFIDANVAKINGVQQIMHGSKATVIAEYDVALNKTLSGKLHAIGASEKIADYALEKDKAKNIVKIDGAPQLATGFLIDNVHAILANKAPSVPTVMISLDQSYAQSVKEFWTLVKENGGFKAPENSSIIRLSATKDHYKPFQFTGGNIKVIDGTGKEVFSKNLGENDYAMITALDMDRLKQSIKNTFADAKASGKKIIFAFDDDAYYQTARDEVNAISASYKQVQAETLKSSVAAAKYFTAGLKDTLLVCSNIMGDFYTDIELAGKGTSYSVGTLGDGRKAVELGTGGTAPDLLGKWKEEGVLQFNPMAFVEGLSYGVKYSGELMARDGKDSSIATTTAAALEKALYATTDNGIILPISKGAFTMKASAKETRISTHTFVKSVELETLKELKGKHPAATDAAIIKTENDLKKMMAYDAAVFAILASDKADSWKASNKAYNEAREAAGKIDPFNPNYDLGFVLEENLTMEKLLALQAEKTKLLKAA
ncbi:MAG: hypothetical protein AABY33_01490 [Pseudomonadota bacterium]